MSIVPRQIVEKYCFFQCPPESCNCARGNPIEWARQEAIWKELSNRVKQKQEEKEKQEKTKDE